MDRRDRVRRGTAWVAALLGATVAWVPAQEPVQDDVDDPFRESSATESNDDLIRGAIRRMRRQERTLTAPEGDAQRAEFIRGVEGEQSQIVDRLSRLALRLQAT